MGGIQFIDGSFVENVEVLANRNPSDIDVFSILSAPPRYLTDPAAWLATGLPFWNARLLLDHTVPGSTSTRVPCSTACLPTRRR